MGPGDGAISEEVAGEGDHQTQQRGEKGPHKDKERGEKRGRTCTSAASAETAAERRRRGRDTVAHHVGMGGISSSHTKLSSLGRPSLQLASHEHRCGQHATCNRLIRPVVEEERNTHRTYNITHIH